MELCKHVIVKKAKKVAITRRTELRQAWQHGVIFSVVVSCKYVGRTMGPRATIGTQRVAAELHFAALQICCV